jgi:myo-inositol-1(or 4)-monophosphatase
MSLTPTDLEELRRVACDIAREAGGVALSHFDNRDALDVEHKGVQDLVTRADREVEALVVARLTEAVPGSAVLGEEGGGEREDASLLWVVDPIDGTSNFVHGMPFWCVSIALVSDGAARVGVVFDPVHDELFHAAEGQGAQLGSRSLNVSSVDALDHAVVAYGESGRTTKDDVADALARLRAKDVDLRKLGAAALGAAWVAAGRVDGFFELHLNPWDALGALVVVREAGGLSNEFLADGGLKAGSPFLVSTPALFAPLRELTGI